MTTPYTIKQGDTLSQLALDNKTTVADIQKANPTVTDPNKIIAGASLVLPNTATTAVGSGSTQKITGSGVFQSTTAQDKIDAENKKKVDTMSPPQVKEISRTWDANGGYSVYNSDGTRVTYDKTGAVVQPNTTGTGTSTGNINNNNGTGTGTGTRQQQTPTYIAKSPDGITDISATPSSTGYAYTSQTPLAEGETFGYGTDGKRYIIGKDGKTKNDPYADQEYNANKIEIQKEAERNALYDRLQKSSDAAHANLLTSIRIKMDANRQKTKMANEAYLALKTTQGFSSGMARYMAGLNTDILQNEIDSGNRRLADIDAQELELTAQAVQAKEKGDLELLDKRITEIDKIQKEKQDTIQKINKSATDYSKALDDKLKALADAKKDQFNMGEKNLEASAPALLKAFDAIKPADQNEFIEKMAKQMGIDKSMVLGAIEKQRVTNQKDQADINAKNRSNQDKGGGKGTITERRAADIKTIIDDFATKIKAGWKGANPQAYEYYKKQILDTYGTIGVKELDNAMELQNISVDNTNK